MAPWESLIRFAAPDGRIYWAPLPLSTEPVTRIEVDAYSSIEDLEKQHLGHKVTVSQLLAPVPNPSNPIICIGLNYRNHAEEAKLTIPTYPPMWYKPCGALANPDEDIPIPKQAYDNFLDYEGEIVVITHPNQAVKNLSSPSASKSQILGYTVGNDLSARLFQDPARQAGQYTYAKAFDKFAPIGPRLIHPSVFASLTSTSGEKTEAKAAKIETRVNGKVLQSSEVDFIFQPETILHFLSQGTQVPGGTAIMTGTPKGVGWFQDPKVKLADGDLVEVWLGDVVRLRSRIVYEKE